MLVGLLYAPLLALRDDQRVLVLDEEQAPFNLAEYSSYLIDPVASETTWEDRVRLEDLIVLPSDSFTPVATRKIGFGWSDAVYHIKTPLVNPTNETQNWIVTTNQIAWGHYDATLVINGEVIPSAPLFQYPDINHWQQQDRLLYFEFEMPANSQGTLYISYANSSSAAPMSIEDPQVYETQRMISDLRIYVLLGLTLGVAVLTVSLLGVLHQKVLIFYALYLTFSTFHLCWVLGLFPFLPFLTDYVYPIVRFWWAAFALMSYLLFQRAFFATAPQVPKWVGRVLLIAVGLVFATTLAYDFLGAPYEPVILWSSICICLITANGFIAIAKQISGRWFFASGCFVLVIMLVPLNLSDFLTAHYTFEGAANIFLFGLVFEAIALSCAMFARVRKIRTEKEEALVAELKASEERRTMSERLATAAHDIQQPLTSMKLAAQDNQKHLDELGGAIEFLDEIVKSQLSGYDIAHDPSQGEIVSRPWGTSYSNMKPVIIALALCPTIVAADINLRFQEGAPKDRFVIENNLCSLSDVTLTIDLSTAPAGLIFDVTEQGAGVEVYQPVELEQGFAVLTEVTDGSQKLQLSLDEFRFGDELTISADLDDTLPNSSLGQIRVADSEIAGVTVSIETSGGFGSALIDASSKVALNGALGCPQA